MSKKKRKDKEESLPVGNTTYKQKRYNYIVSSFAENCNPYYFLQKRKMFRCIMFYQTSGSNTFNTDQQSQVPKTDKQADRRTDR